MNRTLKGCKRRDSPVYLLIRSAIFRICWHPYQGARGFGFGFRWYRCAQPPAKGWHPFGMRQQHKKSKGSGLFLHTTIPSTSGSERYVGKSEERSPWAFLYSLQLHHITHKQKTNKPIPLRWVGSPYPYSYKKEEGKWSKVHLPFQCFKI